MGRDALGAFPRHLDPTVRSLEHALHEASEVGRLDLKCDAAISPPSRQRLVLFRPQPVTGTAERLDMLGVLGTQSFAGS